FREPHLRNVLIQIQERERRHAPEMNRYHASLQFCSRIFVGPEFVADRHGSVARCGSPITGSAGLNRDRAIQITDSRDPTWRIARFTASRLISSVRLIRWIRLVRLVALTCASAWRGKAQKTYQRERQAKHELAGICGLQHCWSPCPWSGPGVPGPGSLSIYNSHW